MLYFSFSGVIDRHNCYHYSLAHSLNRQNFLNNHLINLKYRERQQLPYEPRTPRLDVVPREYLSDYKNFYDVFSFTSIVLNASKAFLFAVAPISAALNEKPDMDEEEQKLLLDDFKRALPVNVCRAFGISFIKKLYDAACVQYMNNRLADKLVKDITKSASRKVAKFGRLITTKKMVKTALIGQISSTISCFTYDIMQSLYEIIFVDKKLPAVRAVCKWAALKLLYYLVSWSSCSLGFALGVLIHPKYGTYIFSTVFEFVGTATYFGLVGIPFKAM